MDFYINWATDRNRHTKLLDTWKVTQLSVFCQECVKQRNAHLFVSGMLETWYVAHQHMSSLIPVCHAGAATLHPKESIHVGPICVHMHSIACTIKNPDIYGLDRQMPATETHPACISKSECDNQPAQWLNSHMPITLASIGTLWVLAGEQKRKNLRNFDLVRPDMLHQSDNALCLLHLLNRPGQITWLSVWAVLAINQTKKTVGRTSCQSTGPVCTTR